MAEPTRKEDTQGTLAYWMGKVDANLAELRTLVENFMRSSNDGWREFEVWRRQVDERLQAGTLRWEEIRHRVESLEKSHGLQWKEESEKEEEKKDKEPGKFGSWAWFRDKYLENAVIITLTVILYKVIEIIVQHWTVNVASNLK